MNSSVEEERSGSHEYITKLGGSLIYDPTQEKQNKLTTDNNLLVNESTSYIDFDPDTHPSNHKSYAQLLQEVE